MEKQSKTAAICALRDAIQLLSDASAQLVNRDEKVSQIRTIQNDLLKLVLTILQQPKIEEINHFLKSVEYYWHINDSLVRQLALRFNCDFKTLKFLIDWSRHSGGFNNNNHQENI